MTRIEADLKPSFIEVDSFQKFKDRQPVAGDTFLSRKIKEEGRTLVILSDGLGSGVKANVLSILTATMAANYIANMRDIQRTAETIMRTLPVCRVRKISYATFTIIDINSRGEVKIIEYDNPPYLLLRGNRRVQIEKTEISGELNSRRSYTLKYSQFKIKRGDRIVIFSDGITQAGIGMQNFPLGWGANNAGAFAETAVSLSPDISARDLASQLVKQAYFLDRYHALDDITCGVVYFRKPRRLLLLTGPPVERKKDAEMAGQLRDFEGKKVICGGTTAEIISREWQVSVNVRLDNLNTLVPPEAELEGVDLVTEGIITLGRVCQVLEGREPIEELSASAVKHLISMLLQSDVIRILMGTRINEAHQDPSIPLELGIRRNIVSRIAAALENIYLKEVELNYI